MLTSFKTTPSDRLEKGYFNPLNTGLILKPKALLIMNDGLWVMNY